MRSNGGAPFCPGLQSPYRLLSPRPERKNQTQTLGGDNSDDQKGLNQVDKIIWLVKHARVVLLVLELSAEVVTQR